MIRLAVCFTIAQGHVSFLWAHQTDLEETAPDIMMGAKMKSLYEYHKIITPSIMAYLWKHQLESKNISLSLIWLVSNFGYWSIMNLWPFLIYHQ